MRSEPRCDGARPQRDVADAPQRPRHVPLFSSASRTRSKNSTFEAPIPLPPEGTIRLAVAIDYASLEFAYALDGEWRRVGPVLDASILSDEAGGGEHRSFTGAFVGMVAFGAAGGEISADFRRFDYERREV